jgi:hypothetical protein
MRTITIENPKLKKLLEQKTEAVIKGREMTEEIEVIELAMKKIDEEIQGIEKKVDLKDLENKAKEVTDKMNIVFAEMKEVEKEIYAKLKASVPPDLGIKYEEKKKVKEIRETERNKLGLKIQKYKDLIIPLTQKAAKGLLEDEFEDFSDVRLENGEVVIDIFSHLEDWKEARRKKLALK